MKRYKRRLTFAEEFDVFKLVLDKFLWLGTALMGIGLYWSIASSVQEGAWFIAAGALVMLVFGWMLIREFEFLR